MTARVSEFVSLLILSAAVHAAQFPRTSDERNMGEPGVFTASTGIRGQIVNDSEQVFDNIFVELCEQTGRIVSRTTVLGGGDFYFDNVAPGYYNLRVMDGNGHLLGEQAVDPGTVGVVRVNLTQESVKKPVSGYVSLAELRHKVPGKAMKEAQSAVKALSKKDVPGVILHLQKALEIDPEFFAARRDLAKAYLMTRQNDKAVPVLEKIIETDPKSVLAYTGLGSVYLTDRRFGDAEIAARKALAIDPSSELGHWLLGCSLGAQGKQDAEALKQFAMVEQRFPRAHILAASILAREKRKDEARRELKAYLDTGNPDSRAEAEEALKSLL